MIRLGRNLPHLAKKVAGGFSFSGSRGFSSSSSWGSREAPSFSSSGDTKNCVTKLGMSRISTLLLTGRPNRPQLLEELEMNIEEFGEGARGAIEVVTRGVAEGDYESLEGLVTEGCIDGLKGQNLQNLSRYDKELLAVNQDDIFFSMVAETKIEQNSAEILFVTFSLPQLGECKRLESEFKKNKEEFNSKMREAVRQVKDKSIDKDELKEVAKDNVREFKESAATSQDSFKMFEENEIQIGNYRFVREALSSNWTISEISQVNSVVAWPYIFKMRWKGRVGMHLKLGVNFYKVLRYEYFVNWISIMFVVNIWLVAAGSTL